MGVLPWIPLRHATVQVLVPLKQLFHHYCGQKESLWVLKFACLLKSMAVRNVRRFANIRRCSRSPFANSEFYVCDITNHHILTLSPFSYEKVTHHINKAATRGGGVGDLCSFSYPTTSGASFQSAPNIYRPQWASRSF